MKLRKLLWVTALVLATLVTGCKDDDDTPPVNNQETTISTKDIVLSANDITQNSVKISWTNSEDSRISRLEFTASGVSTYKTVTTADAVGVLCEGLALNTTYTVILQYVDGDNIYPRSEAITVTTLAKPANIMWNFNDSQYPRGTGSSDYNILTTVSIFDGLQALGVDANEGGVPGKICFFASGEKVVDGISLNSRIRILSKGNPVGNPEDANPVYRNPFGCLKFHVEQNCKIKAYVASFVGGVEVPITMSKVVDGAPVEIGVFNTSSNQAALMEVNYVGNGDDIYLYSNKSGAHVTCWYIAIEY